MNKILILKIPKVRRMPGLMRPPPPPSVPVCRPGLVPVVTISASAGPPSQPPSPAAANLCSFQSAISKREDLCRTENQYLIFRITLTPCGAGCVWPGGPGGWGGVTAAGADRGDTTQKSLHRPSPQPSPAQPPAQLSPAQPRPGEYQQPGCSDWLYRV